MNYIKINLKIKKDLGFPQDFFLLKLIQKLNKNINKRQ